MNYISFGRLDQVLNAYLDQNRINDEAYIQECTELLECLLIKAAGRLNITTKYLMSQDHMDNNAALGTHPYYLDQRAGVNNFLQIVIVGGLTPDGEDATNQMTYILQNAFANVNLSTPGIYARVHKDSPREYIECIAKCLDQTGNIPALLNDDVLIPALTNSLLDYKTDVDDEKRKTYHRLANDYCVDGCWEPILNGISDWTFGMLNCMPILQCTINRGATLDTNSGMLRGGKMSFISDEVTNYAEFQESFKKYMQFFIDQSTFSLYECYMMDEYINPSPLYSAVLGGCMRKGCDKAWGGPEYNIGGTIMIGMPDVVNTTCAIKKWVFDEQKYTMDEVREAMKADFTADESQVELREKYLEMRIIEFVESVTDKKSDNYVPVEERIATFDMDGTIVVEKKVWLELAVAVYRIDNELSDDKELVAEKDKLLEYIAMDPEPEDTGELIVDVTGKAFQGMPQEDFVVYMSRFMQEEKPDFPGLSYKDCFYKPMLELIQYLQDNDFTVYIVSGSERGVVWGAASEAVGLPRSQMIGSDITLTATGEEGASDASEPYVFEPEDTLDRGLGFTQRSADMDKVYNIFHQIGIRPILACGNTDGDFSMLNYAKYNPDHAGIAFLINHDDDEREYQYNTRERAEVAVCRQGRRCRRK